MIMFHEHENTGESSAHLGKQRADWWSLPMGKLERDKESDAERRAEDVSE